MKKPFINIEQATPVLISERIPGAPVKYQGAAMAELSKHIGAKRLGYNLTIVPPGKCAFPFHHHFGNEEMFFVLEGTGELRYGDARFPLRAGDIIACPPGGPETAHQIINTSPTETLRYLAVSTTQTPDLFQYPDSGKTGATFHGEDLPEGPATVVRIRNRAEDNIGYWDGE